MGQKLNDRDVGASRIHGFVLQVDSKRSPKRWIPRPIIGGPWGPSDRAESFGGVPAVQPLRAFPVLRSPAKLLLAWGFRPFGNLPLMMQMQSSLSPMFMIYSI